MNRHSKFGKRLICDECGAKYYDLNKNPAICPKCGSRKTRKKTLKAMVASPVTIDVDEDDDVKADDMDLEPLDDLEINSDDVKEAEAEEAEEAENDADDDDDEDEVRGSSIEDEIGLGNPEDIDDDDDEL